MKKSLNVADKSLEAHDEPLNQDNTSSIKLIEDAINNATPPKREPIVVDIGGKEEEPRLADGYLS